MKANEFLKDHVHRPIFEEMARRIGKTLDEIELGDAGEWPYWQYMWTVEEEEEFREWLTDWMYKNRRKLEMGSARKKWIKDHEVPMLILLYSWKYKGEEDG